MKQKEIDEIVEKLKKEIRKFEREIKRLDIKTDDLYSKLNQK